MMKNSKIFIFLMILFLGLTLASCGVSDDSGMKIKIWTSEIAGVAELTKTQVQRFADEKGVKIDLEVVGMGEKSAPSQLVKDLDKGADIFFFAQDQLARLVQANAISRLNAASSEILSAEHDEASLNAATIRDKYWAYPVTNDNSFVMFYDKRYINEEHLGSLEDLIADCQAANRKFSFNLENEGGWYNASFFFATGCKTEWEISIENKFEDYTDTFNSDNGVIALRGMQHLLKATYGNNIPVWNDSASAADFNAALPSAIVVSGTWAGKDIQKILGDNFGVAPLPSFTVDGTSYQLGSFRGAKLLAVKKQTTTERAKFMNELALYLSGEECQRERFVQFGWGPSNKNVQNEEAVKNDPILKALNEQYNKNSVYQGQIPGNWWSIAESYVAEARRAAQDDDAALRKALSDYAAILPSMLGD